MSIKKKEFKIELILLLCFFFLFTKALTVAKSAKDGNGLEKQQTAATEADEPVSSGFLNVEFAQGNEALLKKENIGVQIPVPSATPEPSPTVTPKPLAFEIPKESIQVAEIVKKSYTMEQLQNLTYLKENLYIVNATTKMTSEEFDADYFISRDLSVEKTDGPQILIFHTHASEGFSDSRPGEAEDTVRGAGALLADILQEKYGYQVLHDTTVFDMKNGKDNRNYAYNDALDYLEELLEQYPSIEVIIDLHRDAGARRVATINGKPTAKVMLFNGLCRNTKGKLTYLPNKNLKDNLAFSFQMKLIGDELYPGLMNRIFLKDYRYNMHLKERYLLIELGTEQNTVEEAKNAMEPLADVLSQVLGG